MNFFKKSLQLGIILTTLATTANGKDLMPLIQPPILDYEQEITLEHIIEEYSKNKDYKAVENIYNDIIESKKREIELYEGKLEECLNEDGYSDEVCEMTNFIFTHSIKKEIAQTYYYQGINSEYAHELVKAHGYYKNALKMFPENKRYNAVVKGMEIYLLRYFAIDKLEEEILKE